MRTLNHDKKIKQINGRERSECRGLPVLCEAYLQEVGFESSPSDHETWSIRYNTEIHVDVHIHLAFTYTLRWSLKRSVK